MTLTAHIKALEVRKSEIESEIESESNRPLPDFTSIRRLKKKKLRIKEKIYGLTHPQFDYDCA